MAPPTDGSVAPLQITARDLRCGDPVATLDVEPGTTVLDAKEQLVDEGYGKHTDLVSLFDLSGVELEDHEVLRGMASDIQVVKRVPSIFLHFDINQSLILSDAIQMKTIEEGVRQSVADLFWGQVEPPVAGSTGHAARGHWVWACGEISAKHPKDNPAEVSYHDFGISDDSFITYATFCKELTEDKKERKRLIADFELVDDAITREAMEELVRKVIQRIQLPQDVVDSEAALAAGLQGSTISVVPALFHLVAFLLREDISFSILFRSFGSDHDAIRQEWNAFCSMRHPLFSYLLEGLGPIDGSRPGVPDRRMNEFHTMYRDSEGDILCLNTFTNGPTEDNWDQWGRSRGKILTDTRNGRDFIAGLGCQTVSGTSELQRWMREHLLLQKTSAIKEDWAWWRWHGETTETGKLLVALGTVDNVSYRQLFFDDNIGDQDPRIVDCRDLDGRCLPSSLSLNRVCVKVNAIEALFDDGYFIDALRRCHAVPFPGDETRTSRGEAVEFGRRPSILQELEADVQGLTPKSMSKRSQ